MASLRSCTSSSEGRRYLAVFGCGTALVCLLIAALAAWGHRTGMLVNANDLYRYQLDKLQAAHGVDTVFLGDSSLGHAIEARYWERLSGRSALNLSLTAVYGYAGSLNMLHRVLAAGRPRHVIIFHTIDMFTRPIEHEAYLRSTTRWFPFGKVPPSVTLQVYVNFDTALRVLRQLLLGGYDFPAIDPERDSLPQRARAVDPEKRYSGRRLQLKDLRPEKLEYLRRIAALCAAEHLDCVYVHGPIVESICRESGAYMNEVNRLIDSTGLRRIRGTPVCVPYADVGDADVHVRPDRRPEYTRRYFELITGRRQE